MSEWESRFESLVDRKIREAEERGEFDDLPGAGQPLPGIDRPYAEDWWLRKVIEREHLGIHALPLVLALRREAQDLRDTLLASRSEAAVRDAVADFNRRAASARRSPQAGPSVVVDLLDADEVVEAWRARRKTK
jgi:Domain of unknown function (DUF1992)